jgi:CheY-like chemotaxis protein
MAAPALGFRFGADYDTKNIAAWSRILEQRRAYMNGEMTRGPFPDSTQRDGYAIPSTDSDGRVSEDASARRATARNDVSVRPLVHELRNYIAPIVNAVHLLRLRGNRDPELSTLVGMIDRQLAAIIHVLDVAVDADRAATGAPVVALPVQAVASAVADDAPRGDATLANRRKLIAASASHASVRCVEAAAPSTARRILVADDSTAVRDSLTAVLRKLGHEVRLAADGTEALEVAERWLPEFVILDVHMPTISGYDVARRLRARFTPTVMRLVMMSGTDLDETTLAGAKRAGFDHCIDKTSALKALADLLRGGPSPGTWVSVPTGEVATSSIERQVGRD